MSKTVHIRAIERAASILGGIGELRAFLRVPKSELLRWMQGVEKLPLDVFLKIVDLIHEHDAPPVGGARRIRVGPNTARCPTCDGIDFLPLVPDAPISYASVLVCSNCGQKSAHGSLVVAAADEGAKRGAAMLSRLRKSRESDKKTDAEASPDAESGKITR